MDEVLTEWIGARRLGPAEELVDRAALLLVWAKFRLLGLSDAQKEHRGLPPSLVRASLARRNDSLKAEITKLKASALGNAVGPLESVWKRGRGVYRWPESLSFEDPIYGQVRLDRRLYPIFYHALFQRLNYVRQLSFAYLVFPSASHSRLSHILGVMRNAKVAIDGIFARGIAYTRDAPRPRPIDLSGRDRDRLSLKAQLCALLHDVGHGPFGHALDNLIPYLDPDGRTDLPDKTFSIKYAEEVFADAITDIGFSVDEIVDVLDKERRANLTGYDVLIGDLIDSPLDVDRMDYLARDAHMTGLGTGYPNVEALIQHMCPFEDDSGATYLTYEESALPHVETATSMRARSAPKDC